MKTFISKLVDFVYFAVGPAFLTFNLLGISVGALEQSLYSDDERFGAAIGVALICLGFLIKFWKRERNCSQ